MGVATVALVYDLTRRLWGRTAGFVAGLVLAVTPITVAISRHNNPDALLALCCVGALWCLVRALQDGRTRWIVLAGVCVGLGFETKMGAALLVVPAIVAAWLWVAPRGRLTAMRQLLAGGAAMVVVGGAWPLLMMLTPASSRPWISGTSDNSILSLILNYNGLGRLDGQAGGPQIAGRRWRSGGGTTFGGATGPLRLFNEGLGGQAGWLLGFAAVAIVALAVVTRLRRADARTGWLVATGGMFLTIAVAFSFAQGIFHPYYVAQLAPFTALLVGAGSGWFLRPPCGGHRRGCGLGGRRGDRAARPAQHPRPADVAAHRPARRRRGDRRRPRRRARAAARRRPRGRARAAAARPRELGRADPRACHRGHLPRGRAGADRLRRRARPRGAAVPAAAVSALPPAPERASPRRPPAPAAASGAPRRRAPGGAGGGMGGGFGGDAAGLTQAVTYARQHGGGAVAISSQSGAAASIISSGANVAGIGGFSGRESQVTTTWLADAVRSGRVRWVLAGDSGGFGGNDGRVGSSQVMAAVAKVGRKVTITSGSSTTTLYDLSGRADALAAAGA